MHVFIYIYIYLSIYVCACLWVEGMTEIKMSVCVCAQALMILPGNSPMRTLLWQRYTHTNTHHCPLPRSTLSSSKCTIPPFLFTQASSTAIATSSVLESACLGNVCQGTDEWTHGILSASSGTWVGRKSNEAVWGGNQRAVSSQAYLFIPKLLLLYNIHVTSLLISSPYVCLLCKAAASLSFSYLAFANAGAYWVVLL